MPLLPLRLRPQQQDTEDLVLVAWLTLATQKLLLILTRASQSLLRLPLKNT